MITAGFASTVYRMKNKNVKCICDEEEWRKVILLVTKYPTFLIRLAKIIKCTVQYI